MHGLFTTAALTAREPCGTIRRRARPDRTLEAIFAEPTRANVKWAAIEALFAHLGAAVEEGAGSRVRVELNGVESVFHRPHPRKDASKDQVRSARQFLRDAGVR